ncbi:hypothetical protein B0H17DRAFT_1044220 [Mycena rosella]|uniref:Uncharacterized protein n=1 Tax=Mycena rosella TaxID=1033263 RepID=A0AAD7DZ66_MYCRO|nr:hypothetical protein B0H17DRAFT_1044220 [Mycena rosella]
MRRRSAPTALRLVQGPVPPRSVSKHTLPSVPRPTFSQPATVVRGPTPRQHSRSPSGEDALLATKFADLPAIVIPPSSSLPGSLLSATTPTPSTSRGSMRGPWDHSGSISLPLDVESLLKPLQPVALAG